MADRNAGQDPGPNSGSGGRTFGPVVLLGLASAALAAVASAKPWLGGSSPSGSSDATMTALDTGTRYPLASAVSLVLLAAWGVLLVTRGRVRRAFAVLTAVAALALLVSVVVGYATLPDAAGDSYDELIRRRPQDEGFSAWFWTAAVCSVVALVPAALAVRLVGRWPEMGSQYDAPRAQGRAQATAQERAQGMAQGSAPATGAGTSSERSTDPDRDLWRALDEGRDPTESNPPRAGS